MMTKFNHFSLVEKFKSTIPKLTSDLHKGQCGRVGIIGGSKEYTGAPYYAGISALRGGADLCYVLASTDAAPVIKSYTPELIVLPLIDENTVESDLISVIGKMHSIVIGPGLGRNEIAWKHVKSILKFAKSRSMPIVLDADALFMIQHDLDLIMGYRKCLLTPNLMEFQRLYEQQFNEKYEETTDDQSLEYQSNAVKRLALKLNNLTILKKGRVDVISDGQTVLHCDVEGSNRRCGGQGDMLCGTLGTFTYWTNRNQTADIDSLNPNMLAAYCAAALIKTCNRNVFEQMHRSMLTTDMVNKFPAIFHHMFES